MDTSVASHIQRQPVTIDTGVPADDHIWRVAKERNIEHTMRREAMAPHRHCIRFCEATDLLQLVIQSLRIAAAYMVRQKRASILERGFRGD